MLDPHSMQAYSLNTQPDIVAEILREVNPGYFVSTSVKAGTKGCKCVLKAYLKQFIRYLRKYPNDYFKAKEKIKSKNFTGVCIHTLGDSTEIEQNLMMLTWFEKFADKFSSVKTGFKLRKPEVFKAFVQMVMEEPLLDKPMADLRSFIKKTGLSQKTSIDYSDFYDFNCYLALKAKNKKKLNPVKELDLEDSVDSSEAEDLNTNMATIHDSQALQRKKLVKLNGK